jgi:hypothetical protein
MDKLLVLVEDSLLKLRIGRILSQKGYAYEVINTQIHSEDLKNYRLLITHSSYRMANLTNFIANIISSGTLPVLFVSQNPGAVTALIHKNQAEFTFIDESKIDNDLALAVSIHLKYQEKLKNAIAKDAQKLNRETNEKLLLMAKAVLANKGMSEKEAYESIRKQAMDEKVSKYVIAEKILKNINK